jgi:DNA-binding NarL/FixJ family response regulator
MGKRRISVVDDRLSELEKTVSRLAGSVDEVVRVLARALDRGMSAAQPPAARAPAGADMMRQILQLTMKQHCALQMLLMGSGNREIADRMGVTESTAKVYVRALFRKFGVENRSQLILRAKPIFDRLDAEQYRSVARIPKDWAETYKEPDPFLNLYFHKGE